MTLERPLTSTGMRDLRERARAVVGSVDAGSPILVLQHGQPAAVLIRHAEAERWAAFERSLAALHAIGVFPELARDTSELASVVDGQAPLDRESIKRIAMTPHEITAPLRTVHITALRERLAEHLDEVKLGRTLTITSGGELVATMISPREYDRLRSLARVAAWFRAAGIDLESADAADIATWVADRRRAVVDAAEAAG